MVSVRLLTNTFESQILKLENLRLVRNVQSTAIKKMEKSKYVRKPTKEIIQYLTENLHISEYKDIIPNRFLKRNSKAPDDLYLINSKLASDIAATIHPYLSKNDKTIIETNPGLGLLTKNLLEAGLNLHVYESTVCFRDHIIKLNEEFPGKLKVYNRDFFSIWSLSYQDRHDNGDRVKTLLSNIKEREWTHKPAMTIIGALASTNFIRHLLLSLIFQFGIMTYGRCELFLMLPPPLYSQLTCGPSIGYIFYRSSSVLFQMFCDHEILLKVPRKSFLPWDRTIESINKSRYKKLHHSVDPDCMYLTKITFKKDLPVPMNRIKHLWYFVNHIMVKRRCKVIPTIEKWIPGSGMRLILANSSKRATKNKYPDMNIFTESGELSPPQILNLYKTFSNWPEYTECPFTAAMEAAFVKMDGMAADDQIQVNEVLEDLVDSKEIETKNKIVLD